MLGNDTEAQEILAALLRELREEISEGNANAGISVLECSLCTLDSWVFQGRTLRDSYHLGQTINNDYGRPYEPGFQQYHGILHAEREGAFSLYVRGEYQHAPAGSGYSPALVHQLLASDYIGNPYPTYIPTYILPIDPRSQSRNPFRIVEATLSVHLLGHEISGGKSDAWLGPAQGWFPCLVEQCRDIYSFRINRVEPLYVPWLSKYLGPLRYDFFYGSLKGHSSPNSPYTHSEMFSFRPTSNFEFGFQRTIIFGGEGHTPVTLHTFLNGSLIYRTQHSRRSTTRNDPGARFTAFNMSYRLPFVRNYLTFYVDSFSLMMT